MKKISFLIVCFMLIINSLSAQNILSFDSPDWSFTGTTLKQKYQNKDCLIIMGGAATLKNADFRNGIIEYDICFQSDVGFPGLRFRMDARGDCEEVYLRSHQSGTDYSLQYTPIFNELAAWQMYFGDGYTGKAVFPLGQWFHVKVVVADDRGEVFIGDDNKPTLTIHQFKKAAQSGGIRIDNSNLHAVRYANFSVTKMDNPRLQSTFKSPLPTEAGTALTWQVSNLIDEKALQKQYVLTPDFTKNLSWNTYKAENTGLINLAPAGKIGEGLNTVFCKLEITSDKAQIKKLTFGYSDRVKVYVNDKILYAGVANFRSRDNAFYGSLVYFDEVYLDLKKGKNEVWLAVSETFGGWGIKAKFEDMEGIKMME